VPGGVGDELASLIGTSDLSLSAILLSLLIAAGLGAIHAVSPGHGKTVMAAYLVGTQGTARHAVALGLTVTASHTLGVVGLALLTLLAGDLLPPERLYPVLGLASGLIVVALGSWLLVQRVREVRKTAMLREAHGAGADHRHDHDRHAGDPDLHRHGGIEHSHAPEPGTRLSWRSLFALGLAGGLVPSASALILLLGAIAAGRPAYGLALAVAFGLGMAIVLSGIGLVVVRAGRIFDGMPLLGRFTRLAPALPWVSAAVVTAAGIFLTSQALVQRF